MNADTAHPASALPQDGAVQVAQHHAVRSMTGFAAVDGSLADGTAVTLTLKAVNHRFLDLHLRLPGGSDLLEQELRRRVKDAVARGHVEITLELAPRAASEAVVLNEDLLSALIAKLRALAQQHDLPVTFDLAALLRTPGVLVQEQRGARIPAQELLRAVLPMLAPALEQFQRARETEGALLVRELRAGMLRLRAAVTEVRTLRAGVRQAQFDRLRDRLRELLQETAVSDDRLLTEAALLAERSDIEEEIVRLDTHIDRFLTLLDAAGAVGKQLDFLLQELQREANTVLSKSGSAAGPESARLVALGLLMKTEIERAREQVQNLE